MLGINSNINSLVAQENLTTSGNALSQAITRLSSGKRINSAADDAAGLAISNIMQTQINGLTQGVSNANDGVSMAQTASSGLSSLTSSLQTIRQLAVQASDGSMTDSDRAALQQEVTQQIAEVNRIASQTTFNGMNVLDGSLGSVSFQVGANVGQSISLDLSQSVSAAAMGKGVVAAGNTLGSITGLSLDSNGDATTSANATITSINVLSDGMGGFTYTDQNNVALSQKAVSSLFGNSTGVGGSPLDITTADGNSALNTTNQLAAISTVNNAATTPAGAGTTLGTVSGISINATTGADVPAGTANAITSITVKADGSGGLQFFDQNGQQLASGLVGDDSGTNAGTLLTLTKGTGGAGDSVSFTNSISQQVTTLNAGPTSLTSQLATIDAAATTQGTTLPTSAVTLGKISGISVDGTGADTTGAGAYTSITVTEGTTGALTFTGTTAAGTSTDITSTITGTGGLFAGSTGVVAPAASLTSQLATITAAATAQGTTLPGSTTTLGTITGVSVDGTGADTTGAGAYTSITVSEDTTGALVFTGTTAGGTSTDITSSITGTGGLFAGSTGASAPAASFATQLATITGAATTQGNTAPASTLTLGTISGISVDDTGADSSGAGAYTSITVTESTTGVLTFTGTTAGGTSTDITSTITAAGGLFAGSANAVIGTSAASITASATTPTMSAGSAASVAVSGTATAPTMSAGSAASVAVSGTATAPTVTAGGTITGLDLDATGKNVAPGTQGEITSITVGDTNGTFTFTDNNGNDVSSLFTVTGSTFAFKSGVSPISYGAPQLAAFQSIDANNEPGSVSNIDISTATGASQAIESIDNALTTVNNIQAALGAAQNRFTSIATTQQAQSTDLQQAQSQIQDANFAQETANLSKAQVLQQAGISVLAQANSQPQQILKLLQ